MSSASALASHDVDWMHHLDSDNAHGRVFPVGHGGAPDRTVQSCIALCQADGYSLAGIEYASKSHLVLLPRSN